MITAPITYRIELFDLAAHLFSVTLRIANPEPYQRIAMPVWIPGSYLVREFAKQVQSLTAEQGGKRLAVEQLDKCTWELGNADADADEANAVAKAITVTYIVHAFDASVRTAFLDTTRGFFNGTSLFMRVIGQEDVQCLVQIESDELEDAGWRVATALAPATTAARTSSTRPAVRPSGWGTYVAAHYDELADSPFELGAFWEGTFTVRSQHGDILHRLVVSGAAATFDSARLLADTKTIVEAEMAFWHGAGASDHGALPIIDLDSKGYVFMLRVVSDGYGGLEHKHSTALIAKRSDLPRMGQTIAPEGYTTLLGLISHEYFHTWNVKRLRPTELASIDYTQENHTQMLWFFEGFTSYYDDLLLRRAGLLSDKTYLDLLAKTINQVLQTPGRLVHPLSGSSFEAWTKYYRPDDNSPNSTVSYYTKGALVALCLDLSLRKVADKTTEPTIEPKTQHAPTLDQVMRRLWTLSHQHGNDGVMDEGDLLTVLKEVSGRSFAKEIKAWVHGRAELPLTALLASAGVETVLEKATLSQRLGLRVGADNSAGQGSGVRIKTVLTGSAAAVAGFSSGDEWIAIEANSQTWRVTSMDDVALHAQAGKPLVVWVSRDKLIQKLVLKVPKNEVTNGNVRLKVTNQALLTNWLAAPC
jgi:predicted metalloprotease with PDZ domain